MSVTPEPQATVTGIQAAAELAPGAVVAERFLIEAMLGIGGMGVVYRATDLTLGVSVALKLLRPELASRPGAFDRFRQELLLARQIASPHVVRIHDIARDGERWLISMDYVDGESLQRTLERRGALPVDEALAITRQLAAGLAAAHARGIVHRDLKPANVLLARDGTACIADFGVARSLGASRITQSGAIVGTPDYLSPEQARGDDVDPRSDLYALGLILYEMLTADLPFCAGTPAENLGQRLVRAAPAVSLQRDDVPAWVDRLLGRLVHPDRARRLRSADELIAAIDERHVARARPPLWWLAAAAAVLAVAIGSGSWLWLQQRDAVPESAVAAAAPVAASYQRWLVLPPDLAASDGDPALAEGLGEHLRLWLALHPGVVVVDGERSTQAIRQFDRSARVPANHAALLELASATRLMSPQLVRDGAQWRVDVELRDADGLRTIAGPLATTPVAAFAIALPAIERALGVPSMPLLALPADDAFAAYARGIAALHGGAIGDARTAIAAATAAAPDYLPAWLALSVAAQADADLDAAADAVAEALRLAPPDGALHAALTARKQSLDGDVDTAIAGWKRIVEASPDDGFARLRLASAQADAGDLPAATATLQDLLQRDDDDPRAWFLLGKLTLIGGDARRAVDEPLLRALVLYTRGRHLAGQGDALNALGIGYARLGQSAEAQQQYRDAIARRRAAGDRRGVAASLRNLAVLQTVHGAFDEAKQHLDEARALHEALNDRNGLAGVDNELGVLAEERGDYAEALAAFRRSLQSREQLDDPFGAAESRNNIGYAHYQLGAYDSAEAFWTQALEAFNALDDANGSVQVQQNLGLLAFARGRWDEAQTLLEESLRRADAQQMAEEGAVSARNLAELAIARGRYIEAETLLQRASKVFDERDDQRGRTDVALLRAASLLERGDVDMAAAAIAALPHIEDASREQQAIAALLEARTALARDDRAAAGAALKRARTQADAAGIRALQLQVDLYAYRIDPRGESPMAAIAAFGNVPLQLAAIEQQLASLLGAAQADAAVRLYRDALPLLRDATGHARAAWLHALGAQALAQAGDPAAAAARTAARDALAALRPQLSDEAQAALARDPPLQALKEDAE